MLVRNSQRPSKVVEFVQNNEPESVNGTPGDTWKKYLNNNGGVGDTFHDLEMSHANSRGGIGSLRDRIRNYLQSVLTPSSSYYLLEDGVSKYQLEDGSGFYILE